MNNPMQMLMQIMQGGGKINPQQIMNMFGNRPEMQQAQQMLNSGNDPRQIIKNIAKQKGIEPNQLKQMAQQFGVKL